MHVKTTRGTKHTWKNRDWPGSFAEMISSIEQLALIDIYAWTKNSNINKKCNLNRCEDSLLVKFPLSQRHEPSSLHHLDDLTLLMPLVQ